ADQQPDQLPIHFLLRLSIFGRIVQPDLATSSLLWRINNAAIEWPRINVQAHRPLAELARIVYAMHWLQRIDRARMARIHHYRIRNRELTSPIVQVLRDEPVILYLKTADWRRHPAVLVTMVVHRARLPNLPADRNQLVQRRLVDQVPSVVLTVPSQIG